MWLNWKRLLVVAGIIILLILLVRGCAFACGNRNSVKEENTQSNASLLTTPVISVYMPQSKTKISMPLEEYLVGVVAAEMPASFMPEALKAQAVAARTYTLRTIQNGGCTTANADICGSSKCCQAYHDEAACKKKWGGNYQTNYTKIRNAVKETQTEVLLYQGNYIEALYHSSSGGQTEDSENVFAVAQPYLRGVKSTHEEGAEHITDEERIKKSSFVKKINTAWPKAKLKANQLKEQVEIKSRFESGRVESIKLGGVSVTGRELRGALGLRSAWFSLSYSGDYVVFTTRGYGHGVGMSQTGANGMAKEGADYQEILAHYYTGAVIAKNGQ